MAGHRQSEPARRRMADHRPRRYERGRCMVYREMGIRDVSRKQEKVNVEGFVEFGEVIEVPPFALQVGVADDNE
jgi:hypothetical protein